MIAPYLLLILPLCVDRDSCCGTKDLNALESLHDNFKDPKAECSVLNCSFAAFNNIVRYNDVAVRVTQCLYNCVGKKMGFIDSDNRFDKDTYIELTKDIDLEPENRKIFDDCIDDYGEYSPDEDEYNDVGLMIEHCLYSAIQLQCEPEKQKDQVGCEQLQKFLTDGADQDVCPTFTS